MPKPGAAGWWVHLRGQEGADPFPHLWLSLLPVRHADQHPTWDSGQAAPRHSGGSCATGNFTRAGHATVLLRQATMRQRIKASDTSSITKNVCPSESKWSLDAIFCDNVISKNYLAIKWYPILSRVPSSGNYNTVRILPSFRRNYLPESVNKGNFRSFS